MKKLLIIFFIIFSVSATSQEKGFFMIDTDFIAADKQKHAAAGMFLGAGGYALGMELSNENRKYGRLVGIALPILVGSIKEMADSTERGNKFDVADLAYTTAGGVLVTLSLDFLVGRAERRYKKRLNKLQ